MSTGQEIPKESKIFKVREEDRKFASISLKIRKTEMKNFTR